MPFKAGDLVSCKDDAYFAQLSLKKNSGIVLEVKKNSCKVMFDDFKGGYWLTDEHLSLRDDNVIARRPKGDEAISPLFREVSSLVQLAQAETFEIEKKRSNGKETLLLSLCTDKLTLPQLDELRRRLGARLVRLDILPHMMAELLLEVEYQV